MSPEIIKKWKGGKPASSKAVAAAEKEIGHKLPPDYKAFLLKANGGTGHAGENPLELYPAKRIVEATEEMSVHDVEPDLFLIGDWKGDFVGINWATTPPRFVSYNATSGETTYRGAAFDEMLDCLLRDEPATEPAFKAKKGRASAPSANATPALVQIREFGDKKDRSYSALAVRGRFALAAGLKAYIARLWDWQAGKLVGELAGKVVNPAGACINPSATRGLVWTGWGYGLETFPIQVWDLQSGAAIFTYSAHTAQVLVAAFVDDDTIVSLSREAKVRRWHAADGTQVGTAEVSFTPAAAALSPDGSVLAVGGKMAVELWDPVRLAPIRRLREPQENVAGPGVVRISPDNQSVLVVDRNSSSVLSAVDGHLVSTTPETKEAISGVFLEGSAFYARDLKKNYFGLIDSVTGSLLWQTKGSVATFARAAAADDGLHVLTGGDTSGLIRVWRLERP